MQWIYEIEELIVTYYQKLILMLLPISMGYK